MKHHLVRTVAVVGLVAVFCGCGGGNSHHAGARGAAKQADIAPDGATVATAGAAALSTPAGGTAPVEPLSKRLGGWCSHPGSYVLVGDIDGDQVTDLLCYDQSGNKWWKKGVQASSLDPGAALTFVDQPDAGGAGFCQLYAGTSTTLTLADIDGDGRADLVCRYRSGTDWNIAILFNEGGAQPFGSLVRTSNGFCHHASSRMTVIDMTNDRQADILCSDETDAKSLAVAAYHSRTFPVPDQGQISDVGRVAPFCPGTTRHLAAGDFDGNGMIDLVCHAPGAEGVRIQYRGYNNWFDRGTRVDLQWCQAGSASLLVGDFNGDGVDDLACSDSGRLDVRFGIGRGTFTDASSQLITGIPAGVTPVVMDIDGDRRADLVWQQETGDKWLWSPPSSFDALLGGQPLIAANYFLDYSGESLATGPALALPLSSFSATTGVLAAGDRTAVPGRDSVEGYLAYGPYLTACALVDELLKAPGHDALRACASADPGSGARWIIAVDTRLSIDSNAFSAVPVATLDITGTGPAGLRVLRRRQLFPQDFLAPRQVQSFRFTLADYETQWPQTPGIAGDRLEFRIQWHGGAALSHLGSSVTPLAFEPHFGKWTSEMTSQDERGNFATPAAYARDFDPNWLSRYRTGGGQAVLPPLFTPEAWRRDIVVGAPGSYPDLGPYSLNRDVMRYHIQQARAAGLGAFRVFTYGDFTELDPARGPLTSLFWTRLADLLDVAKEEGFAIALDFSPMADSPRYIGPQGTPRYDLAVQDFAWLVRRGFLDHPAYLKTRGRPVFFLPSTYSARDPAAMYAFVQDLKTQYYNASAQGHAREPYIVMTPYTTYPMAGVSGDFHAGPYVNQVLFFQDSHPAATYERYFDACPRPPQAESDLLACRCRYAPEVASGSGFCVLAGNLLRRESMADFRPHGIDSYYDWDPLGLAVWPEAVRVSSSGTYTSVTGRGDYLADEAFKMIVDDARRFRFGAVLGLKFKHDSTGWRRGFEGASPTISPTDADGQPRARRLVAAALAARPDMIVIENWNGWGEAANIEPAVDFADKAGTRDPDLYLKIIAGALGRAYVPPVARCASIDSLRAPVLKQQGRCQ